MSSFEPWRKRSNPTCLAVPTQNRTSRSLTNSDIPSKRWMRLENAVQLIRLVSSAELRSHDTLSELAHRPFRLRVVDAHMIADPWLPIEQILEVCDASVRRLPLNDVASGLAEDDAAVDATLGLCHQHLGRVAQSLGGNR